MEPFIYTMVHGTDWAEAVAAGAYAGSADDRHDGFLHFSTAAQLRASAAKHRKGQEGLVLVKVESARLGDALVWEPAKGGSRPGLFPHLYGRLPVALVTSAEPLPLGADGLHLFPADIP
ncbi:DUF952 domain-containing protein [Acetobacteraceae bacterium H6797]|nr:DUF952 domain-containing protein [Acetobacteraceae bacterium H6797]